MARKLSRSKKKSLRVITAVVVVVAGFIALSISLAATATISIEPEDGTKTGSATAISSATASGGAAVVFGDSFGGVTGAYPGQPGNPVGFAAHASLGTTPWPGGSFMSGTAANPTVYKNYVFTGTQSISGSYITFISCDFVGGTGVAADISGSHLTFTGNRFQSNNKQDANVRATGSNLTFSYNSFTPLAKNYTSPPGSVWPSAGAGQNTTTQTADVNAVNGNLGYEYGINMGNSTGPLTLDHSDFWGFGNAVVLYASTAQITITDNWMHDAADAGPQGYHTDGVGYLNSGAGPSNVRVQHNTIASLGNTNGLAFQAATSGYDNIQIIGNFLSGFGYTVALRVDPKAFTNTSFKNNVFATDIKPIWNPFGDSWSNSGGNVWKCNTYSFRSGTTWTSGNNWKPTAAIDGKYWLPDSTTASSTDYSGNTTCP